MSLFQARECQEIFAKHFCDEKDVIWTEYGGFSVKSGVVKFLGMESVLGGEEVTDYGDILAKDKTRAWNKLIKQFKDGGYKKLQLDYVREDSETIKVLKDGEKSHFTKVTWDKQEVSPYIDLPESFEEYLESLKRKHRKELKRKINRLLEKEVEYENLSKIKREDFEEFIGLHKLSDPEKDKFMSKEMKAFFWDVARIKFNEWQQKLWFLKIEGKRVAGCLSFENKEEVLTYNSGFDPEFGYYSVGLGLKVEMIKQAIKT